MKAINLDVFERLRAVALLARQEGSLEKLKPYSRVVAKLELSDKEKAAIGHKQIDAAILWNPDAPGKGVAKRILVEDGDYEAFKQLVQSWPRFSIEDIGWTEKVASAETVKVKESKE